MKFITTKNSRAENIKVQLPLFPTALIAFLFIFGCGSGGGVKSKGKKLAFQIIAPDIRIEKFPDTFNMKAEGPVKIDCSGKPCTEAEITKLSATQIKSFPKNGEWKLYVQKEDEKKNKISVFNASGTYKDNKREGVWKFYAETGEVLRETNYANDQKNGLEKKFNLKSIQTEETNYVNDKKEGKYWKKNPKDILEQEGNYKNDLKDGAWVFYYSDGAKKSDENYSNDKRNGQYKSYYKDGKTPMAEGSYANGLKTSNWKNYYDDGKVQSEGGYQPKIAPGETAKPDEEPKSFRSGLWKEFYKSGDLFAEGNRQHTRTGVWTFYSKGNVKRFKGQMANEMMMKSAEVFDDKGELIGNGSLIFSFISINENDELKSSFRPSVPYTYYKNGKKSFEIKGEDKEGNSNAIAYDDNGSRVGEGPIATGTTKKHGCWNMNGKKVYYVMDKPNPKFGEMQGCK